MNKQQGNPEMIIEPKVRGFLCTTAHPLGCAHHVDHLIATVQQRGNTEVPENPPKSVLVIGGSAGYGLACRVMSAYAYGANTLSVSLEKPPKANKTGSAGWYNDHQFRARASEDGLQAHTINGDAFSNDIKQQTIAQIRSQCGQVDLVVYSLAAPRRTKQLSEDTHKVVQSVIKPIGTAIQGQTLDTQSGKLKEYKVAPATDQEIDATVAVMGGEDWYDWIKALSDAGVLSSAVKTVAFSYLGGALTEEIYGSGTLGAAKQDLEAYCRKLNNEVLPRHGAPRANVAVLKAVVTQSSAAIPSLPLYISLLYQSMKSRDCHEDVMAQIVRLFTTGLYPIGNRRCQRDKLYRLRLDDLELQQHIQEEVKRRWAQVASGDSDALGDVEGYRTDFLKLFGFNWPAIDYAQTSTLLPE